MSLKNYLKNLPDYWSANFLAFVSLFCVLFTLYAVVRSNIGVSEFDIFDVLHLEFFVMYYILNSSILGFGLLFMIFPLSIPFVFLLKSGSKKSILLSFLGLILTFIAILFIVGECYIAQTFLGAFLILGDTYSHTFQIFLPLFIAIPIFCIIDCKKNCLIPNTFLTNNKFYRFFVNYFFYYFWLMYIPFMLGLIFCLYCYIGVHYH
ncbi:MAG: hypothetical protein NC408_01550 [Candidatus Gastranaerophilales bacterium]|nr:hypothetical protein [Candidatus Gastranaerophilales bacterium]MCM1072196.1 hypothetical protein [Bacteroides sp.]